MEKEVVVVDCSDSAVLLFRRLGPTGLPWHWNRHGKSQPLGSKTSTTLAWLGWARTSLGSFQVFFSRVPTCIRTLESERPSSAAFTSAHITWIFWMVQGPAGQWGWVKKPLGRLRIVDISESRDDGCAVEAYPHVEPTGSSGCVWWDL